MSQEEKPKLIIDEDWKTQVEREREQLRQKGDAAGDSAASGSISESDATVSAAHSTVADRDEQADDLPPPPPASFPFLVSMLGTQALAAMGQLGDDADAPKPRLDYAKHYIDLLGVLEEKTKGNLSTNEYDLLADWLHQLRMSFVNLSKRK